jgi:hypothetical protein
VDMFTTYLVSEIGFRNDFFNAGLSATVQNDVGLFL